MIAAIYARKSTDQSAVADEAKSVTRQIEHATAYAAGKGWTVAEGRACSWTTELVAPSSPTAPDSCGSWPR